jgi:hypothetical protein
LLTGAGIYFRPFVIALPLLLGLVCVPGNWKRRIVFAVVPTLVAFAVLAPWTIRNYHEFHRFIPTRTGLGQAVFEGIGAAPTDEGSAEFARSKGHRNAYGTPTYDDFLLGTAARAIADHPDYYLRLIARRSRFLLPCLLLVLVWKRWRWNALAPVAVAFGTVVPYLLVGDDTRFYLPAAPAYIVLSAMSVEIVIAAGMQVVRRSRVSVSTRA